MENGASGGSEAAEDIPEIELIIKASTIDGRRKGACLFCQVSVLMKVCRHSWLSQLAGIFHGSIPAG